MIFMSDWRPRHRGKIFCSPSCGGGCTMAAHKAAHRDAKALAKRMGIGWTPEVHENLGWHYAVRSPCRRIRVCPLIHRGRVIHYTAFLNHAKDMPGRQFTGSHKNPKAAVIIAITEGVTAMKDLQRMLTGLEFQATPKRLGKKK